MYKATQPGDQHINQTASRAGPIGQVALAATAAMLATMLATTALAPAHAAGLKAQSGVRPGLAITSTGRPEPMESPARIFYIDYDGGNDAADGLSPATAWKHAPGDSKATGKAAALNRKFLPGDVLRFKGGVRYLGTIRPRGSGAPGNPVVLDGSSWGPYRAIIDGGNELSGLRRCSSAADCLGNPNWRLLWRANLPADTKWFDWLFVDDRPLMPSQYPSVATATEFDDINRFLTIPKAQLNALLAGSITAPLPAGLDKGMPVLSIWARGNLISYAHDITVTTGGVNFANATWDIRTNNPYTDRDNRFALLNLPLMVNRPGLFAMSPRDGVVIFWPHATAMGASNGNGALPTSIARRAVTGGARRGINPIFEHMVVRGFSFANFSREGAVYSGTGSDSITIADNIFRGNANAYTRAGAIGVAFTTNVRILRNELSEAPGSPGIIIDNTHGPVEVACNRLSELGRTGIRLINVRNGTVRGNYLKGIKGAHSNAITAYLDIRDSVISDNIVVDSVRPLTVKGIVTPYFSAGTPGTLVKNNIFINSDPVAPAVTSYGITQNVTIENNFIGSPVKAISLLGTDTGLIVRNNVLVGSVVQPRGMSLVDSSNGIHQPNGNGAAMVEAKSKATIPASVCS